MSPVEQVERNVGQESYPEFFLGYKPSVGGEALSGNLWGICRLRGMLLKDLAERVKVTPSYLSRLPRQKCGPNMQTLLRIAANLGIDSYNIMPQLLTSLDIDHWLLLKENVASSILFGPRENLPAARKFQQKCKIDEKMAAERVRAAREKREGHFSLALTTRDKWKLRFLIEKLPAGSALFPPQKPQMAY